MLEKYNSSLDYNTFDTKDLRDYLKVYLKDTESTITALTERLLKLEKDYKSLKGMLFLTMKKKKNV